MPSPGGLTSLAPLISIIAQYQVTISGHTDLTMDGEWKSRVGESYNKWKYNDIHGEVKSYFNNIQHSPSFGETFKRDSTEFGTNLSQLKDQINDKKNDNKIISKSERNTVNFLGDEIDVGDEDEEIVDRFCQETIFSGFWKTITKLCNMVYLRLKSVGDVLKKLFKKLIDFFEAGMKSCVTAIGNVISSIVGRIYPLPDYEVHQETGLKIVKNFNFVNYGETVQNVPQLTFFPKSVEDIQKVILFARQEKKRVRCAGMKHSWSEMYSDTGQSSTQSHRNVSVISRGASDLLVADVSN